MTGNITHAAKAADVTRRRHYTWLEDPEYRAAFEVAHEEAIDGLELEARRRAIQGVRRLKFDKDGKPLRDPDTGKPYEERIYSDALMIFLLKAARPGVYRDRVEHTGSMTHEHEYKPTPEEIEQAKAERVLTLAKAMVELEKAGVILPGPTGAEMFLEGGREVEDADFEDGEEQRDQ